MNINASINDKVANHHNAQFIEEVSNSNLSDYLKSLLVAAIANTAAGSRQCRNRLENTQAVYDALSDANCPLTTREIAQAISPYASSQFVNAHMKKLRAAGCEIVQGKPQRERVYGFHAFLNAHLSEQTLEKLASYYDRNKEGDKIYHAVSLKDLLEMCGDELVTFYPNYAKHNTYMLRK